MSAFSIILFQVGRSKERSTNKDLLDAIFQVVLSNIHIEGCTPISQYYTLSLILSLEFVLAGGLGIRLLSDTTKILNWMYMVTTIVSSLLSFAAMFFAAIGIDDLRHPIEECDGNGKLFFAKVVKIFITLLLNRFLGIVDKSFGMHLSFWSHPILYQSHCHTLHLPSLGMPK